jgi:hypothetical protein
LAQKRSKSTAAVADTKKQSDKFKDAAKEHGCDPDEKRWEERLKKVAGARDQGAKST